MGGGSKAPAGYQPTWQPGADSNYQNLVQNATPWATSLPGQTIPGAYTAATNIQNNPYNATAQSGANQVAANGTPFASSMTDAAWNLGLNNYFGNQMNGAQLAGLGGLNNQLQNYSDAAMHSGNLINQQSKQVYGETQGLMPSTTQGANYAPGLLGNAAGLAGLTSGTALGAIPGLTGGMDAANAVLQSGFDPQSALYNRTLQQTMDQQNALNAMYGLSSSGYGAGLAGDAAKNFNIDWQNNQLARESQALGAYGTEQGVVANNLTGLLGSAANNYANLTNAGVNQYTGMTSNAVSNLDALATTGMNARAQGTSAIQNGLGLGMQGLGQVAGNINSGVNNFNSLASNQRANLDAQTQQLTDAQQMLLSSSQAPQLTYQNQQQADLAALASAAQTAGYSLGPTSSLANLDAQYMQLGQGATSLAQNAAKINNEQSNAQMAGIGKLVGTVASIALAPATGGLSLFGLGASSAAGAGGMAGASDLTAMA